MKEESVINVLIYLFHHHIIESCEMDGDFQRVINALKKSGFKSQAIREAICWLEVLIKEKSGLMKPPSSFSTRVLSSLELERMNKDCFGFLLKLEHKGILSPENREVIINQVLSVRSNNVVEMSLVKWVTLMVLFNQPNHHAALACLELLVLDNTSGEAH